MVEYLKTKKGYFYKLKNNGEKKRISREEFNKKNKTRKNKKMIGGGRTEYEKIIDKLKTKGQYHKWVSLGRKSINSQLTKGEGEPSWFDILPDDVIEYIKSIARSLLAELKNLPVKLLIKWNTNIVKVKDEDELLLQMSFVNRYHNLETGDVTMYDITDDFIKSLKFFTVIPNDSDKIVFNEQYDWPDEGKNTTGLITPNLKEAHVSYHTDYIIKNGANVNNVNNFIDTIMQEYAKIYYYTLIPPSENLNNLNNLENLAIEYTLNQLNLPDDIV